MGPTEYEAQKAVARSHRAFYAAFEALDLVAMRAVWHDGPEVKCVHPGGEILVGIERVLASWKAIFEHTDEIAFELVDLDVQIGGELAWTTLIERIRIGPDAASVAAATNVYSLRKGEWRMLLHHASPIAKVLLTGSHRTE